MLPNTAQSSLSDVLRLRREQLKVRVSAITIMTVTFGGILGWQWLVPLALLYLLLQGVEVFCFCGRKPWLTQASRAYEPAALAVFVLNSATFGAPTLLLAHKFGGWGDANAAYLLCGTILNSVLMTIGCRPAFSASSLPYFAYVCLIPFATLQTADPPTAWMLLGLIATGMFMIFNVWQLWLTANRTKAAEIAAACQYVAERDANEQRLFQMTQQDALTGLVNRHVLQASLARNVTGQRAGALLMIDLDGFKYVNDTLGHSAGDVVLCVIAERIRGAAGPDQVAARLGGDEFALLMPDIADAGQAAAIADALIAEVSQPVMLEGHQINIGASIGIVIHPLHGDDAGQLFANADLALYQAKAEGRHCSRLYQPDLRARAQGKVLRDTELGLALERGEFEMFYQPQFRLADGALTGAEALLRWRHPVQGLLKPAAFLGALEGGLLSARVGAWAIETACRQAAAWRAGGATGFRIGVNLFGAQFRSGNLVAWVSQACAGAGLPPEALEIEITENVILRHEDNIIAPLQELRTLGVGVAFDDYGTGFASLSMLTRYPVSRLKIDRSFIQSICHSPPDLAIVHAIIALARGLNLHVTAEGIETQDQAATLKREGCDEGQGYYLGMPMSAADFTRGFILRTALQSA